MSALTIFGATVVTAMLVFYALEDRAPVFVLLFAGTCLASSAYGFLQGAWPIGIIEAIWTGVAVQRWRVRTRRADFVAGTGHRIAQPAVPVACDMSAFSMDERQRYQALRTKVMNAIEEVLETPSGFRGRVGQSVQAGEIAEWMSLERRCCPFLDLGLRLTSDRGQWLELQGGPDVKELVRAEFAVLRAPMK
jgi:hypothetical protein